MIMCISGQDDNFSASTRPRSAYSQQARLRKRRVDKVRIGGPRDFVHVSHGDRQLDTATLAMAVRSGNDMLDKPISQLRTQAPARRKTAPAVTPSIIKAVAPTADAKHLGSNTTVDGMLAPSSGAHPFLASNGAQRPAQTMKFSPSLAAIVRDAVDEDLEAPHGRDARGRPLEKAADGEIVTSTARVRNDRAWQSVADQLKA